MEPMARAVLQTDLVESTIREFVVGVIGAIPELLAGAVFLALAYVGIRVVLSLVRFALERAYPPDQHAIVELGVAIVSLFLWFGAALALFNVLGLDGIAASLGTASGFVALGVSYALSDMIADTVAGVYLLRDPDFNPGDRVTAADVTGEVRSIGLRKSRLETDEGDTVVIANQDVDARWTLEAGEWAIDGSAEKPSPGDGPETGETGE
jgi:small-conductance mechanosensitive channel